MIKSSWSSPMDKHRPDKVMVSIRLYPDSMYDIHSHELPPREEINGKRISLDEAKKLNLAETHITLGYVDAEDLTDLINHLTKIRDSLPVHEDL